MPSIENTRGSQAVNNDNPHDHEIIWVDDYALNDLYSRPSLTSYLRSIWSRRHYIFADTKRRSLQGGEGTLLGRSWILLTPAIDSALYIFVFGFLMKVSRGMDNYVGFLVLGVVFYRVLTAGLTAGSGAIQASRGFITAFSFPRASVLISSALRRTIDHAPAVVIAVIVASIFQPSFKPTLSLLGIPFIYIGAQVFSLGFSLIIARITAFVPDVKRLVAFIVRGLFFVSGVFFSLDRFDSHPIIQKIVISNPIYQFLEAIRSCVLSGEFPNEFTTLYISAWSLGILIAGLWFFWRSEARYANILS